jgi:hypothetical protein
MLEIFKEKIRLFAPEIKLIKDQSSTFYKNECITKIQQYEELSNKIQMKIEKLRKNRIDINYETVSNEDIMKTKQILINFEKAIDK